MCGGEGACGVGGLCRALGSSQRPAVARVGVEDTAYVAFVVCVVLPMAVPRRCIISSTAAARCTVLEADDRADEVS